MNYREGYDQFITEYETACRERGVTPRNLTQKEAIMYLSKSQKYLGNNYDLVEADYNLNLTAGKYQYTEGTDQDDIPAEVKRIDFVHNSTRTIKLDKKNIEELVPAEGRGAGLPTAWTLHGTNSSRTLEIDSIPDKSYGADLSLGEDPTYRLIIHYVKKLYTYTGSALNTFSDIDFTDEEEWGGSFSLPEGEWDDLIIMGAVAMAIGSKAKDLKAEFYDLAETKGKKKPHYTSNKLKYSFGVP